MNKKREQKIYMKAAKWWTSDAEISHAFHAVYYLPNRQSWKREYRKRMHDFIAIYNRIQLN